MKAPGLSGFPNYKYKSVRQPALPTRSLTTNSLLSHHVIEVFGQLRLAHLRFYLKVARFSPIACCSGGYGSRHVKIDVTA
jgi:hypothetical protein